MGSTRPSLPLEIVEHIFDDVNWSDRRDLKSLALVCRTFLLLSRKYLFRDVTISLEPDRSSAIEGVDHEHSKSSQLLRFLAADLHVASIIRRLRIQKAWTNVNASQSSWETSAKKLADIAPRLLCAQDLSIHSSFLSDWTLLDDSLRKVLIQLCQLPTIQNLELQYMGLLRKELFEFVRVPKLTLVGVYPKPEVAPSSSGNASSESDDWDGTSVLRDLSITLRSSETADEVYSVVRAATNTLQSLKWLSSPYHDAQDTCLHTINLGPLSSLLHLAICTPLSDGPSFEGLVNLFGRHNGGSTLEVIEIFCDYQHLPDENLYSTWRWETLDATLTCPTYAALQSVRITAKKTTFAKHLPYRSHDVRSRESLALFRRRLPQAHSRGLIVGFEDNTRAAEE